MMFYNIYDFKKSFCEVDLVEVGAAFRNVGKSLTESRRGKKEAGPDRVEDDVHGRCHLVVVCASDAIL
jgi:hypothetical protein